MFSSLSTEEQVVIIEDLLNGSAGITVGNLRSLQELVISVNSAFDSYVQYHRAAHSTKPNDAFLWLMQMTAAKEFLAKAQAALLHYCYSYEALKHYALKLVKCQLEIVCSYEIETMKIKLDGGVK